MCAEGAMGEEKAGEDWEVPHNSGYFMWQTALILTFNIVTVSL